MRDRPQRHGDLTVGEYMAKYSAVRSRRYCISAYIHEFY